MLSIIIHNSFRKDQDLTDIIGMVHKQDLPLTGKTYPHMINSMGANWGLVSLLPVSGVSLRCRLQYLEQRQIHYDLLEPDKAHQWKVVFLQCCPPPLPEGVFIVRVYEIQNSPRQVADQLMILLLIIFIMVYAYFQLRSKHALPPRLRFALTHIQAFYPS